jgi:hypothetical protein
MKHLLPALLFLFITATSYAQNVGVGNTVPASKLDVSGDLALREGTAITVASGVNTLTLPAAKNSVYRLTGSSGAFSISSISAGNDGMLLTLINATGQVMTVTNGTIQTNTGADLVATNTVSVVSLVYNGTLAKWLVSSAVGFPTTSTATNIYTADGSLTGNRTLAQGADNLTFSSTNGNFNYTTTGNGNVTMGKGLTNTGSNNLVTGNNNIATSTYGLIGGVNNKDNGTDNMVGGIFNVVMPGYGHSIAVGYGDTLAGSAGAVFGYLNKTGAFEAFAQGDRNTASGQASAVFGGSNVASGSNSFVTGGYNTGSGTNTVVTGNGNTASGTNTLVTGNSNTVTAASALVTGQSNSATGNYSMVSGFNNADSSAGDIVGGYGNKIAAGYGESFAMGYQNTVSNGSAASFGVQNNVSSYEGFAQGNTNTVSGQAAAAFGNANTASGANSFVTGNGNTGSGTDILVSGHGNTASGGFSVVLNNTNTTTTAATTSIAGGFQSYVSANLGMAIGWADTASGQAASAFGNGNAAPSYAEHVIGTFATDYTPLNANSFNAADRLFNVGNGTNNTTRSDAFTILKNGNVGVGNNAPTAKLQVNGTTSTTNLQMTNGGASGYVLQSDATGNASWVAPSTLSANNIYNADGSLTGNRTLTQGTDNLTLSSTTGNLNYATTSGNVAMGSGLTAAGTNNFVVGKSNNSTGTYSLVSGVNNTDNGTDDVVGGYGNTVTTGYGHSIVVGNTNTVSASAGAVFGFLNTISAFEAFGQGDRNTASGQASAVFGASNVGSGSVSFVTGSSNTGSGANTLVAGLSNTAPSYAETAIGVFNIGNGITSGSPSDALTVLKNGNVGIGSNSPTSTLQVNGTTSTTNFQMTNGATNNYILKSDASGNASWVNPNTIASQNIYNTDGTLTGNRTVTMGGNNIGFVGGSLGLGTASPYGSFDYEGTNSAFHLYDFSGGGGGTLSGEFHAKSTNGPQLRFTNTTGGVYTNIGQSNNDFSVNDNHGHVLTMLNSNGNVGIGTSSPTSTLQVNGTTSTTNFQMTSGGSNGYVLQSDASGNASWVSPSSLSATTTHGVSNAISGNTISTTVDATTGSPVTVPNIYTANGSLTAARVVTMSGNTLNFTGGDVGIGTASTNALFNVNGNAVIGAGLISRSGSGLTVDYTNGIAYAANTDPGDAGRGLSIVNEGSATNEMAVLGFRTNTAGGANNQMLDMKLVNPNSGSSNMIYSFISGSTVTDRFTFTSAGYLGIGTTSPAAPLQIGSSTFAQNAAMIFYTGNGSQYRGWQIGSPYGNTNTSSPNYGFTITDIGNSGTPALAIDFNTHNVGIGSASPLYKLHIISSGNTDGIIVQNTAGGGGAMSNIYLSTYGDITAGISHPGARISAVDDGAFSAHITLSTKAPGADGNAMTERVRITSAGRVGINTTNPAYPLDVEASVPYTYGSYGYLAAGGAGTSGGSGGNQPFSIYASGRVSAIEFDAYSDARIKHDRTASNAALDLHTLMALQPVEFRYIDSVANGADLKKGFIAQEVMETFPQAVQTNPGFVPSIYQTALSTVYNAATKELTVKVKTPHGLKAGDKVKTVTAQSSKIVNVVAKVISDTEFTLSAWSEPATTDVFVYGKEVPDFHSVDYDRIYTLNVSATQELARRLMATEKANAELKSKNEKLENSLNEIKTSKADASDVAQLKAEIETLKQIVGAKAQK